MKILLLTDMPPCKNYTAGLVLDQLCRFLPKGSIACFAVVNPSHNAQISEDLDWIPVKYNVRPRENWVVKPRKVGRAVSYVSESYNSLLGLKSIIANAVQFGRDFGATAVWCILEGQTMIRLAVPVARELKVPLLTEVWDPPGWWMRANNVDGISTRKILSKFDQALRESARCATASWAMAERYSRDYGTGAIPVIPSLDGSLSCQPATGLNQQGKLVIGMAGQIYATQEWESLISALDAVGWNIAGNEVVLRVLGRAINIYANRKMRVEFCGWASQKETIKLMSEADILYCPYWFDPVFEEEARLSFPSKLTTYLASGRPVLFHGPQYASPARFIKENNAGLCCHSLDPQEVISVLDKLVSDKKLYAELARSGSVAFAKYLTLTSMRKSFAGFLQVEEDFLLPV